MEWYLAIGVIFGVFGVILGFFELINILYVLIVKEQYTAKLKRIMIQKAVQIKIKQQKEEKQCFGTLSH